MRDLCLIGDRLYNTVIDMGSWLGIHGYNDHLCDKLYSRNLRLCTAIRRLILENDWYAVHKCINRDQKYLCYLSASLRVELVRDNVTHVIIVCSYSALMG